MERDDEVRPSRVCYFCFGGLNEAGKSETVFRFISFNSKGNSKEIL